MQTITLTGYTSGATLYVFPSDKSLSDWTTYRVLMTEGTGADAGRYVGSVDPANGSSWVAFAGAAQPASWGDALVGVGWELTATLIQAKTDLIGTGTIMLSAPVSGDGELLELILDTDYLAANGRALEWTFDQITGITTAATGKFGLKNSENGTEVYVNSSGAVTDLGGGTFKVSFDIPNTALTGLSPEEYDWSVEVLEGTYKITIARNRQRKTRVNIVEKQT